MLFAVVSVGYLLCTALILAIPQTKLHSLLNGEQRLPRSPGKQMWDIVQRDVKGSWQLIRKDRNLYLALLQVSFVSVLLLVIGQLAPVFVQKILSLPADDLTILFAPAGFGLVLGGLCMPLLATYLRKTRMITLGSLVTAAGLILLPLSQLIAHYVVFLQHWELAIVGVVAFFLGIALDMINIPAQTVMQERAPEEERGRVLSFQFMLYNAGSIPVLLFAGVITDTLGIATVLYSLGVVILLFQWWASRPWRQRGGPALASDQSTPSETDHRLSP
jgi:MFS-type transporter involved in bile tolerance (Atg22 family)